MVEFALLLPLLLLLLLALVQIGALARDRLLLAQASRAGAREAAITDSQDAVLEAATRAAPGLDPARLQLSIERAGARGSPVTVDVVYEITIVSLLAGWLMPAIVTLDASATARQEFG